MQLYGTNSKIKQKTWPVVKYLQLIREKKIENYAYDKELYSLRLNLNCNFIALVILLYFRSKPLLKKKNNSIYCKILNLRFEIIPKF